LAKKSGERPIFHPELGQALKAIRDAKQWSVSQARIQAKGKGHAVTDNQLRWLEQGKTKSPDQEVLRAVAAIYGLDYMELARQIVAANYGSDLVRHTGDQRSGSRKEGPADELPASARRIAELESELSNFKTRFGEVQAATHVLFRIAIRSREGRQVAQAKASGNRAAGGTGR